MRKLGRSFCFVATRDDAFGMEDTDKRVVSTDVQRNIGMYSDPLIKTSGRRVAARVFQANK